MRELVIFLLQDGERQSQSQSLRASRQRVVIGTV